MGRKKDDRSSLLRLVMLILTGAALVKELRTPADQRTWHGEVACVVPYDFRMPTVERARSRLWDPEGPLVGPQVFGVGWSLNFGRLFTWIRETMAESRG